MAKTNSTVTPSASDARVRSVTRNDVAFHAGVSSATVSNVINCKNVVTAEKREKVYRAIEKLSYKPNIIARCLKTRETMQVALVSNDITNQFYAEVALGMEDEARKSGYAVCMINAKDTDDNITTILKRQFDGLLLATDKISIAGINGLASNGTPIVFIGNEGYQSVDERVTQILIDIYGGACRLFEYFFQKGHSKIGFISARQLRDEHEPDYRFKAYVDVLGKNNVKIDHSLIAIGVESLDDVFAAAKKMVTMKNRPTAVFSGNDHHALAVFSAIIEQGLRIPQDISVAGFDNLLISNYYYPKLTTVDLPKYGLGQKAMQLLLKKIRKESVDTVTMQSELIIRDSA